MKDKIKNLLIYIIYIIAISTLTFFSFQGSILLYQIFFVLGIIPAFVLNTLLYRDIYIPKSIKNFYNRCSPLFLFMLLFLYTLNSLVVSYNLPAETLVHIFFPLPVALIAQVGILIGFMLNKNNKKEFMNFKISLLPFVYLAITIFFIINIKELDSQNKYYFLDDSWLERENAYDYITQEPPYSVDDIKKIKTDKAGLKLLEKEMIYYEYLIEFYEELMEEDVDTVPVFDEINKTNDYIKILYSSDDYSPQNVRFFDSYVEYNNLNVRIIMRYLLTIDDERITIYNSTQNNSTQNKDFLNTIVFIVNENNPIDSISSDEIKKIYTGEYQYWSDLDSNLNKDKIFAFRNEIDISDKLKIDKDLIHYSKMHDYNGSIGMFPHMVEKRYKIIPYINFDNAIGFSSYASVLSAEKTDDQSGIKLLAIDGVYPSEENIKSGKYSFFVENHVERV